MFLVVGDTTSSFFLHLQAVSICSLLSTRVLGSFFSFLAWSLGLCISHMLIPISSLLTLKLWEMQTIPAEKLRTQDVVGKKRSGPRTVFLPGPVLERILGRLPTVYAHISIWILSHPVALIPHQMQSKHACRYRPHFRPISERNCFRASTWEP